MANEFHTVWVSRKDLQKVLDAYPEDEICYFGVELDSIEGDQILWVLKPNASEPAIIINKPYHKGE